MQLVGTNATAYVNGMCVEEVKRRDIALVMIHTGISIRWNPFFHL